ncbi:putative F-box domain, leucine-rich repeat domain superfamily, F-box-like domain superfamily [Helianthus debilis subsp. tardiflorus]
MKALGPRVGHFISLEPNFELMRAVLEFPKLLTILGFTRIRYTPCNVLTMPPKAKSEVETAATRNWLELPSDLTLNILQRIGVVDILENAQKVCTAWRQICKDPAMWKIIYIEDQSKEILKHAVDRSQGQLLDLTVIRFCDDELLQYVADRSSQLKRLEIVHYFGERFSEALKKLSLLEELSLVGVYISEEDIEAAGRYCPLLKTLKMNQNSYISWKDWVFYGNEDDHDGYDDDFNMTVQNDVAIAIGKNLPELTHLELIGNGMRNTGLQGILDGCRHLETLDLRQCYYINLKGNLGIRCYRQIKCLKLPHDHLDGYLRAYDIVDDSDDECEGYDYSFYDDDDDDDDHGGDDEDEGDRIADMYILREMMDFIDMYKK